LIPCVVPVSWQSSADVFSEILRRYGCEPQAIIEVDAAWAAFVAFMQTEIDGLVPEDSDADGSIVQWGRSSGHDMRRPYLSFSRQLAVPDAVDPERQPSYWHVELQMTFDDGPGLTGIDELDEQNSGFDFDPIGPARAAGLVTTREHYLRPYPQLRVLWGLKPAGSDLALIEVC
jgi:hypothetical protein